MAVESTCVLQDYFDQIDKVESNCSTPRKYSHKWSEFLRFNLYFCHVYRWILLFILCYTKISDFFDMAKSWALGSAA